jgi:hypothetical protein
MSIIECYIIIWYRQIRSLRQGRPMAALTSNSAPAKSLSPGPAVRAACRHGAAHSRRAAASASSGKLPVARGGLPCGSVEESIQSILSHVLFEFRPCNQKRRYWLEKESGAGGRTDTVKLREAIESRLGRFVEAGKIAEKRLGSFSVKNPLLYHQPEIGVNPVLCLSALGIFQKRAQTRKHN